VSWNALSLFLMGVLQVALVAANTRQVAQARLVGSFFVGIGISAVWAYNVHHIAIGGVVDGACYALGAGVGTVLGIIITRWFYRA
jgi:hypothetical protein